jgi:hypothetical protein
MKLKSFTDMPDIKRGRPQFYQFNKLQPLKKLIIPGETDLKKQKNKVVNALNNYKKSNGFEWSSAVIIENNNISVYRLN